MIIDGFKAFVAMVVITTITGAICKSIGESH